MGTGRVGDRDGGENEWVRLVLEMDGGEGESEWEGLGIECEWVGLEIEMDGDGRIDRMEMVVRVSGKS